MKKFFFILVILTFSGSIFPSDFTPLTNSNSFYINTLNFLPQPICSLFGNILQLLSGNFKKLDPTNMQKEGDGGGWIPCKP